MATDVPAFSPALAGDIAVMRPGAGGDMALPAQALTAKKLSLIGPFRFRKEFIIALSLMRKGLIDAKPVITHGFSPEHALEALWP